MSRCQGFSGSCRTLEISLSSLAAHHISRLLFYSFGYLHTAYLRTCYKLFCGLLYGYNLDIASSMRDNSLTQVWTQSSSFSPMHAFRRERLYNPYPHPGWFMLALHSCDGALLFICVLNYWIWRSQIPWEHTSWSRFHPFFILWSYGQGGKNNYHSLGVRHRYYTT